jgi:hypothetical protein
LQRLLAGPAASQARQVVVAPRQWFAPAYQAQLDISGRYNPGWIAV